MLTIIYLFIYLQIKHNYYISGMGFFSPFSFRQLKSVHKVINKACPSAWLYSPVCNKSHSSSIQCVCVCARVYLLWGKTTVLDISDCLKCHDVVSKPASFSQLFKSWRGFLWHQPWHGEHPSHTSLHARAVLQADWRRNVWRPTKAKSGIWELNVSVIKPDSSDTQITR